MALVVSARPVGTRLISVHQRSENYKFSERFLFIEEVCQNGQKSIKLSYASDFIFHFWGRFREFFECGGGADS